jgi:hypothetical protein
MASVIAAASIKISMELFSWTLQRMRADLVSLFDGAPRSRPLYALAREQAPTGSFSEFSAGRRSPTVCLRLRLPVEGSHVPVPPGRFGE